MRVKCAIIMMGIQGSGKSEYVRTRIPEEFVRISLDELNTRNKEQLLLEKCFKNNLSFVIDNTNPTRTDRARYLIPAKENGYRVIGIFMQSKIQDCIKRNNRRIGKAKLPAKAIAATSNKLEMPDYAEGFDELYFVRIEEGEFIRSEWREDNEI